MRSPRTFNGYKPPAIDGAQARANATLFLTQCVKTEHLTAEKLAHSQRLSLKVAEELLRQEIGRRQRHG